MSRNSSHCDILDQPMSSRLVSHRRDLAATKRLDVTCVDCSVTDKYQMLVLIVTHRQVEQSLLGD